jgi:hypothetical protein
MHTPQHDPHFSIYRKPTFTDTTIPYTSCHPAQHKYAKVRFLCNRLHYYHLNNNAENQELNIIHNMSSNSSLPSETADNKQNTEPDFDKPTHKG